MLKFTPADARTTEVIAEKVRRALAYAPRVTPTAIARACGITRQAVSGWSRTGRIDKKHLHVIANMTGTSLSWWLDGIADSEPIPADSTAPRPTQPGTQEPLAFYGTPDATRLVAAFERLTAADRQRYLAEIEELATKTQAIVDEFRRRDSPLAAAFGTAVSDHEVAKRMRLRDPPKS